MNIKILDSWLREYVKTEAKPYIIAEQLSLSSVGIEHLEKYKQDMVYDIEVTTNRPEMMSVMGLAREAATVLTQNHIQATFVNKQSLLPKLHGAKQPELIIKNDTRLIRRICAVIMEVEIQESPQYIKDRLEASGIRSINNVIDVTNYVMREVGHPTHVFDYDRLTKHTLIIRESKKGEKLITLDQKEYTLTGGDIVADNGQGEIIDLMGVMGTANSVVTKDTKRVVFFIDNVEPAHIRKTSMEYGIRTEAAIINEKGINPEYASIALARGIALYQKIANAKIRSEIIDIYPHKPKSTTIRLLGEKLNTVIGVTIPLLTAADILTRLGFDVKAKEKMLEVTVPPIKTGVDMQIPEDLIEEIARIYGYHNIPNTLPAITQTQPFHLATDDFYWEDRVKDILRAWGFTEVYTYPMVSQALYNGNPEEAVTIKNPLTEEFVYMRLSLLPSMLQVIKQNQDHAFIHLFEIGNIYRSHKKALPTQTQQLAGVLAKPHVSFFEAKGVIEQLLEDMHIVDVTWKYPQDATEGAVLVLNKKEAGRITVVSDKVVTFELDFDLLKQAAKLHTIYKPVSIYPPIVEDLAIIAPPNVLTGEIIKEIEKQSPLITSVSLLDKYQDTRTFHIIYQSHTKNLTDGEVGEIREKILKSLANKLGAEIKK